jgi:peptide/nickel transport system ATP-binding protein
MTHGSTTPSTADPIRLAVDVRALEIAAVGDGRPILSTLDFTVAAGEVVGVAGETGSGKTTLGLALLGYQRDGLRVDAGSVRVNDDDVTEADPSRLQRLRGDRIAYVPQDPAMALNPALRVRNAFREVVRAHGLTDRHEQNMRLAQLLESVALPSTAAFQDRFPHELSGGQQQRLAIAIAFAFRPAVVVMDEPTTGLDASSKLAIMGLVRALSSRYGSSVVLISHDLRMLIANTDRIVVMRKGRIVDDTTSSTIVTTATDPYTHRLFGALPDPSAHRTARKHIGAWEPLLRVDGLSARHGRSEITHGIEFELAKGECLALVGESGSGKTTIARCVAGLHSDFAGSITWRGRVLQRSLSQRVASDLADVQYVFQNPYSSLNPRCNVGTILATAARLTRRHSAKAARMEAASMLERVGLEPRHLESLPASLSGGQRQRVALARALMTEPQLLVCDEVTSSLDVSVQAEIVGLLQQLQHERDLSMLFITHDLALVSSVASRVIVLKDGVVVETGSVEKVLEHPTAEYTKQLLAVVD